MHGDLKSTTSGGFYMETIQTTPANETTRTGDNNAAGGRFKVKIMQGKRKVYEREYDTQPTVETVVEDAKSFPQ